MIEGIIIKGIAGFYYVNTDDGVIECKARGIFKKKKITPLVGDRVLISLSDESGKGMIEEIKKRKVEMIRPAVANVDQAVIVVAIKDPAPNMILLDKLTVLADITGLDVVICFNKVDIDDKHEVDVLSKIYRAAGFDVVVSSAKTDEGIELIKEHLKGKISVFAGASGVGKSSLLNEIKEGLALQTGEVSEKIKRGKHTTRHSELIKLDFDGWVVDTPGFTSLDINYIEPDELRDYFIEFDDCAPSCKFNNCLHINEPGCEVKRRLETGEIQETRYNSYIYLYNEIKDTKKSY
jgi:ribosome biogenesis GTPase